MESAVKVGRLQGGEEEQAKRISPGEVEESTSRLVEAQAFQEDLKSFGFTQSLAKPKIEKELKALRQESLLLNP